DPFMRSSDEAQTDRRRLGRDAAAYAGLGRMTKKFARNNICGLHPSAETRLIRCQGFVLVCWVAVVPAEFGLELGWGFVAERRVQTLGVVDGVDEGADLAAGVVDVGVGSGVDLLLLERLHEAFRLGVVVNMFCKTYLPVCGAARYVAQTAGRCLWSAEADGLRHIFQDD